MRLIEFPPFLTQSLMFSMDFHSNKWSGSCVSKLCLRKCFWWSEIWLTRSHRDNRPSNTEKQEGHQCILCIPAVSEKVQLCCHFFVNLFLHLWQKISIHCILCKPWYNIRGNVNNVWWASTNHFKRYPIMVTSHLLVSLQMYDWLSRLGTLVDTSRWLSHITPGGKIEPH